MPVIASCSALLLAGVLRADVLEAAAEQQLPSLLLGGAAAFGEQAGVTPVRIDPRLPRGVRVLRQPRPEATRALCSARRPVCLQLPATSLGWPVAAEQNEALRAFESAYERVVIALGLPAPMSDGALGGGPELDLYWTPNPPAPPKQAGSPNKVQANPSQVARPKARLFLDPAGLATDSASAFCTHVGSPPSLAVTTRCVAYAIAARLDAAETPALRDAYATFVASRVAGSDVELETALRRWQANPQIAALSRDPSLFTSAAQSWFGFLDETLGASDPGALPTALFALSRRVTGDAHPEWNNEPDVFDVLRRSLDDDGRKWASAWRDFAANRAVWGGLGQDVHPELPRISFDWELTYSSLPRKVAAGRSLEPLGSAVIDVLLDDIPLGARLGVALDWEEPGAFVWSVLALDRDGRQMNRWDLPYLEREYHLEQTFMNFEGAARLVFVATNLGGVDLSHPFDPDHEPWEPHAYSLYLTPL